MEKSAGVPGKNGCFLDLVSGKVGNGGIWGRLRVIFGWLVGLGRSARGDGRWTMEEPEGPFYAVSGGWYVYGM
jgi:hypothetical protein